MRADDPGGTYSTVHGLLLVLGRDIEITATAGGTAGPIPGASAPQRTSYWINS